LNVAALAWGLLPILTIERTVRARSAGESTSWSAPAVAAQLRQRGSIREARRLRMSAAITVFRSLQCPRKLTRFSARGTSNGPLSSTQQLGFELAFGDDADPPNYVGFRRDAVELHMQFQFEYEMGTIRLALSSRGPRRAFQRIPATWRRVNSQ
jgi:hypothetical protein